MTQRFGLGSGDVSDPGTAGSRGLLGLGQIVSDVTVAFRGQVIEVVVDGVGAVAVGEGERVGVLARRRGWVGVAEMGLGLEDLTAGDEEGGDVVS